MIFAVSNKPELEGIFLISTPSFQPALGTKQSTFHEVTVGEARWQ
jgi:hypothetical protein